MNKKERRLRELSAILKDQPMLTMKELSQMLHVSEMTIRRDLKHLEGTQEQPEAAESMPFAENGYDILAEESKNYVEKDRIAKFAASLMQKGDVVIIDSGTSASAVAKYVPEAMDLTVIGYNYRVLSHLCVKKDIELIFAGGVFHSSDLMFESPKGIELIQSHRANKLFLSAYGIHEKLGITCAHNYEVQTKRAAIDSSQEIILLADSSKFGVVRTAHFADLEEIDVVITDTGISSEWKNVIKEAGVKLYIV